MRETMWDDIYASRRNVLRKISECNIKGVQDDYAEGTDVLDVGFYYDLIVAHIVNLLVENISLYVPNLSFAFLSLYFRKKVYQ